MGIHQLRSSQSGGEGDASGETTILSEIAHRPQRVRQNDASKEALEPQQMSPMWNGRRTQPTCVQMSGTRSSKKVETGGDRTKKWLIAKDTDPKLTTFLIEHLNSWVTDGEAPRTTGRHILQQTMTAQNEMGGWITLMGRATWGSRKHKLVTANTSNLGNLDFNGQ